MKPHLDLYHFAIASVVDLSQRSAGMPRVLCRAASRFEDVVRPHVGSRGAASSHDAIRAAAEPRSLGALIGLAVFDNHQPPRRPG